MGLNLRKELLDLLERDREFRHAAAGLLGLSAILGRLEKHDVKFNEVLEELRRHGKILEEHTARLEAHDAKFNEVIKRLDGHDRKFNRVLSELRGLKRDMGEVKAYVERTSLTLEEEAREVVGGRLKARGFAIPLNRLTLPGLEVDLYGCSGGLCVMGEVSTRAGVKVLDRLERKIEKMRRGHPQYLGRRVVKVVYALWVTDEAVEEARRRGVWVLRATGDVTPPRV